MSRACSTCDQELPDSEFYVDGRSGKLRPRCRRCFHSKCEESRHRRAHGYEGLRSRRRSLTKLGLNEREYDALLEAQNGVCAICGMVCPSGKRLAVDHSHTCCPPGRACSKCRRSLLCLRCNLMLGQALDRPDLLRKAADYLELF